MLPVTHNSAKTFTELPVLGSILSTSKFPQTLTLPAVVTVPELTVSEVTFPDAVTFTEVTFPDAVTFTAVTFPDDVIEADVKVVMFPLVPLMLEDVVVPAFIVVAFTVSAVTVSRLTGLLNDTLPAFLASMLSVLRVPQTATSPVVVTVPELIAADVKFVEFTFVALTVVALTVSRTMGLLIEMLPALLASRLSVLTVPHAVTSPREVISEDLREPGVLKLPFSSMIFFPLI
jgi:hypothetical protein